MRTKEFLRKVVTSHSGISSKRLCGIIGWIMAMGLLTYCTVTEKQAPNMIDTYLVCDLTLLGIDSVTGIWKNFNNNNDDKV